MTWFRCLVLIVVSWLCAVPAWAQDEPETPSSPTDAENGNVDDDGFIDSITVRGNRIVGVTIGNIEPELSISEAEIEAYGASTFADLLAALEPSTSSGRGRGGGGRPIVLLNGVRVANFGEIRRYPTEALARVDVLSEEVAVQYGYRSDQRVINFVLKPGFKALTAEVELEAPTAGGRQTTGVELGWLQFGDNRRTSIDGEYTSSASLLERERGVTSSVPRQPFAIGGNVGSVTFGAEIDPALSALVGESASVAAIPLSSDLSTLVLRDFAATAGKPNVTSLSDFRTLRPKNTSWSIGATHNRTVFDNSSVTISAKADQTDSESLLGLPTVILKVSADNQFSPFSEDVAIYRYLDPTAVLMRNNENTEVNVATTFAGNRGGWRYNVVADIDHTQSVSLTDRRADVSALQAAIDANDPTVNPFADLGASVGVSRDRAESKNTTIGVDATLNGSLYELPAGKISTTIRAILRTREFSTDSSLNGVLSKIDLARDTRVLRSTMDIPLSDRDADVLPVFGDLSMNLRAEVEDLSDVGTLFTYGAGVRWSPIENLRLTGSWRKEEGAPSITQLGNPVVDTPNVRVFDFEERQTVNVIRRSGGNTDLVDDSRRVIAVGARYRLRENPDISVSTEYTDEQIDNPISPFPSLTPEIEAAFADRFTRVDDKLVLVDVRPINFQQSSRRQLRTGMTLRKRLQSSVSRGRPQGEERGGTGGRRPQGATAPSRTGDVSGRPAQRPPSANAPVTGRSAPAQPGRPAPGQEAGATTGGGRAEGQPRGRPRATGGRGRGFGGRPSGGGFLSVSAFHTWHFEQTILIRDGVAALDLLNGSAIDSLGGQPEHQFDSNLFYVMNGLGMGASAKWQAGTFVSGGEGVTTGTSDLEFSPLATINGRVFVNFDSRPKIKTKYPILKGVRLSLEVNNIFDERLDVRDSAGTVPITYQPDLIDPVGRTIEFSLRKLFY